MDSAQWLTYYGSFAIYFLPFWIFTFALWEGVNSLRRHWGNKSSLTKSQYVEKNIRHGSKYWYRFAKYSPFVIITSSAICLALGVWLIWHWEEEENWEKYLERQKIQLENSVSQQPRT